MNKRSKSKLAGNILLFVFLLVLIPDGKSQTLNFDNPLNELNVISLPDDGQKQKKEKRKDEFKVYAGVSVNQLNLSHQKYKTTINAGWLLGASYKRGRFFYWELGARYSNPLYNLEDTTIPADSSNLLDGIFGVRNIDIPVTFGINFLSITSRIVGLRVFLSAVPAFAIGVGNNDLNISMDDINAFNFYGQGGVGVDVTFLFIEIGMKYGFQDLFKNYSTSNPYQLYLSLGFRF